MTQSPVPPWARAAVSRDGGRALAMMGLFFLVVCAVGILRPVKNVLALDGLGATAFYKVYLVSALVILFVPLLTHAANRVAWRRLLPALAMFFAFNLVLFRLAYVEGSATFGLVFYGWFDLFAAALVAQFFMATQLFFDARSAKRAYPMVIAGGSLGATLGGGITGFFAESVGTPNLLLVAAAIIVVFALVLPWVWGPDAGEDPRAAGGRPEGQALVRGELTTIFANRHVQLIAASVLLTILVKQLVDFQFNALTKEVFVTRDAVAAFQGKFNAATQWLPLVVLLGLRPALQRWGVGVAVLLLPVAMFGATLGLAVAFGLWAAVAAKGSETALRYSAERAGREILYVPVPDDIKFKAKAYIDVAVEKGVGKVLSAGLIALLLVFMDLRGIAIFTTVLAGAWLGLAVAVRREYVRALARSIEGRFASLKGVFLALSDASSLPVLRRALDGEPALRTAFALELVAQAPSRDIRALAPELNRLVSHADEQIREAALRQLARVPDLAALETVRPLLLDGSEAVRDAAVRVLAAADPGGEGTAGTSGGAGGVLGELLASPEPGIRTAALRYLIRGDGAGGNGDGGLARRIRLRAYVKSRRHAEGSEGPEARVELALAAGGLGDDPDAGSFLDPFLDDPDPRVRATALRSAALLGRTDCTPRMIAALAAPETRLAARDALVTLGPPAVAPLARALLDSETDRRIRRTIPRVLGAIPDQGTVDALLELVLAPETDQLLDYRSLKALGKLRARQGGLSFPADLVLEVARLEAVAARRYANAAAALCSGGVATTPRPETPRPGVDRLLESALADGWRERRESVFRCLGLLYPSTEVYRSWLAVGSGVRSRRANALEWLETTVGRETYQRFSHVLEQPEPPPADQGPHDGADPLDLDGDGDPWIALLSRARRAGPTGGEAAMELIEKVFLLQGVDLLHDAAGGHLALLATIAEEIEVPAGTVLMAAGEPVAAMYVVTRGEVVLRGVGEEMRLGPEQAFGTWALIDESPSPLEATTTEPTRVLRITRMDLHDLLADHSELAVALLKGLANRMRNIVA
jgi:ATP:ADP antiporter, AAA family